MTNKGVHNDDVSSIKVPAGCKAILYQHGDFTGWQAEFAEGDYPHDAMGSINDDASSIKVIDAEEERYEVTTSGTNVTVTRKDKGDDSDGWAWDLRFKCC